MMMQIASINNQDNSFLLPYLRAGLVVAVDLICSNISSNKNLHKKGIAHHILQLT